jgi:hypothetical protein
LRLTAEESKESLMKKHCLAKAWLTIFCVLFGTAAAMGQQDVPRFEIGVQFSLLSLSQPSRLIGDGFDPDFIRVVPAVGKRTEPGFGGRFTYNLTRHIAFEAEGNLFPRSEFFGSEGFGVTPAGRIFQGQFGVKAGKRFRKFGVFGKARPGFVGFTKVNQLLGTFTINNPPPTQPFVVGRFAVAKELYFSADVGGVVEFYMSRRIFTRVDLGDTIIHYRSFPGPGTFLSHAIIVRPPETKHNLQFTAGVGFRF